MNIDTRVNYSCYFEVSFKVVFFSNIYYQNTKHMLLLSGIFFSSYLTVNFTNNFFMLYV